MHVIALGLCLMTSFVIDDLNLRVLLTKSRKRGILHRKCKCNLGLKLYMKSSPQYSDEVCLASHTRTFVLYLIPYLKRVSTSASKSRVVTGEEQGSECTQYLACQPELRLRVCISTTQLSVSIHYKHGAGISTAVP